jgi:hypothetical protein
MARTEPPSKTGVPGPAARAEARRDPWTGHRLGWADWQALEDMASKAAQSATLFIELRLIRT